MPRLPPAFLRRARSRNVLLPLLLRECRSLESAENELRWLTEHAIQHHGLTVGDNGAQQTLQALELHERRPVWQTLVQNARRRSRSEPLQYILGTQPFGDLEILCRKGVLIPRSETETYTRTLVSIINDFIRHQKAKYGQTKKLRILDLCTGSGCISLLLHSMLKRRSDAIRGGGDGPIGESLAELDIVAVDISREALKLTRDNIQYNIGKGFLDKSAEVDITLRHVDVLELLRKTETGLPDLSRLSQLGYDLSFDVIVSNPPYVSPVAYRPGGGTSRSVRLFEPKLALVPPPCVPHLSWTDAGSRVRFPESNDQISDVFYQQILNIAKATQAKITIMEIGSCDQATRVRNAARKIDWGDACVGTEIWNDDGERTVERPPGEQIIETSNARAVVVWKEAWADWRRTSNDVPPLSITHHPPRPSGALN